MSTVPLPSSRTFYLRTFIISFVLVAAALALFLFAVQMEAGVAARGIILARDQLKVRAPLSGLVELGWYEGEIHSSAGQTTHFRIDSQGNGCTAPQGGHGQPIHAFALPDGRNLKDLPRRFHELRVRDQVWPGQPLALLHAEEKPVQAVPVPQRHALWWVVQVAVESGQAVQAGDVLAIVVPLDPATGQPLALLAELKVAESDAAELAVGQPVHLHSTMYNARLYGGADGLVEHIAPWAEASGSDERHIAVTARITATPSPLHLGTSVEGKIVVGRKPVYRIILEH